VPGKDTEKYHNPEGIELTNSTLKISISDLPGTMNLNSKFETPKSETCLTDRQVNPKARKSEKETHTHRETEIRNHIIWLETPPSRLAESFGRGF